MSLLKSNCSGEVIDVMTTVEIALRLNPHKDKNKVVRRVCTHMRHRLTSDVKKILDHWRQQPDSFKWYDEFMTKAGL